MLIRGTALITQNTVIQIYEKEENGVTCQSRIRKVRQDDGRTQSFQHFSEVRFYEKRTLVSRSIDKAEKNKYAVLGTSGRLASSLWRPLQLLHPAVCPASSFGTTSSPSSSLSSSILPSSLCLNSLSDRINET